MTTTDTLPVSVYLDHQLRAASNYRAQALRDSETAWWAAEYEMRQTFREHLDAKRAEVLAWADLTGEDVTEDLQIIADNAADLDYLNTASSFTA